MYTLCFNLNVGSARLTARCAQHPVYVGERADQSKSPMQGCKRTTWATRDTAHRRKMHFPIAMSRCLAKSRTMYAITRASSTVRAVNYKYTRADMNNRESCRTSRRREFFSRRVPTCERRLEPRGRSIIAPFSTVKCLRFSFRATRPREGIIAWQIRRTCDHRFGWLITILELTDQPSEDFYYRERDL